MPQEHLLIIGSSEQNPDLFYATKFIAPDPFVFLRIRGRKYILISDLEIDRARKQASVHSVVSTSSLAGRFRKKFGRIPSLSDLVMLFLKDHRVKALTIPSDFPYSLALNLKKGGIRLACAKIPFFPDRMKKTGTEISAIVRALRATEKAMAEAVKILRASTIRKGLLYSDGTLLTSESLRRVIHHTRLEHDCSGERTIVSCGRHSIDPHDQGSGPLRANKSIIFDIFPRDCRSLYYADFSRTLVRGKASPKLRAMFKSVSEAQEIAFGLIRDGVPSGKIHNAVLKHFEKSGFETGLKNGRMQGFFHSTGHGLGLEVHEPPCIGPGEDILKKGHVVTVEPGLYYQGVGGVRLEDLVLVTKNGCRNLTRFPKFLEI